MGLLVQSGKNIEKLNKYNAAPKKRPLKDLEGRQTKLRTDKGEIVIELFPDEAPMAVTNHLFLVEEEFYDGIIFHRREEGFVVQAGDPIGQGYGGPGYSFADEPVARAYEKGIVAMANSGPDTNGSQFFIMLSEHNLPPLYTIFGKVVEGLDVVDRIQVGDQIIQATVV